MHRNTTTCDKANSPLSKLEHRTICAGPARHPKSSLTRLRVGWLVGMSAPCDNPMTLASSEQNRLRPRIKIATAHLYTKATLTDVNLHFPYQRRVPRTMPRGTRALSERPPAVPETCENVLGNDSFKQNCRYSSSSGHVGFVTKISKLWSHENRCVGT